MTMSTCRECQQPVSTEAPTCPGCGARYPTDQARAKAVEHKGEQLLQSTGNVFAVIFLLVVLGIVGYILFERS